MLNAQASRGLQTSNLINLDPSIKLTVLLQMKGPKQHNILAKEHFSFHLLPTLIGPYNIFYTIYIYIYNNLYPDKYDIDM